MPAIDKYLAEYKLFKSETLHADFFRIAFLQMDYALLQCSGSSLQNADNAVHEIRKTMKRLRALLKLYRSAIGEEVYTKENKLCRNISSGVSDLRISCVQINTLRDLLNAKKILGHQTLYLDLIREMENRHGNLTNEMVSKQDLFSSILSQLQNSRQIFEDMPVFSADFLMLSDGLKKMFKRCRLNLQQAMEQPTPENVHNFRKPVKYLWNQMLILKPIWPGVIGQIVRSLDTLGERLGVDHDLAELEQLLVAVYGLGSHAPLVDTLEKERCRVQKITWPLAQKVFSEKPSAFGDRIMGYWEVSGFEK